MIDAHLGDHICHFYDTEAAHWLALTAFLRDGLQDYLRHEPGLGHALASGQFETLSAESVYCRTGAFHPQQMIAFLTKELQRSAAEGYAGLRGTGEMSWALHQGVSLEDLVTYESSVNALFAEQPVIALCQYDCRRFPAETLLELAIAHPRIVLNSEGADNPHYLAPGALLSPKTRRAALHRWHDPNARQGFSAFLNTLGLHGTDSPPSP